MKQFWIKSFTNPNKEYIVRFFPETDKFTCDCPNFLIKHLDCKHIKETKRVYFAGKKCGRCSFFKKGSEFWPNQKWCVGCFSSYRKQKRLEEKLLSGGDASAYAGLSKIKGIDK